MTNNAIDTVNTNTMTFGGFGVVFGVEVEEFVGMEEEEVAIVLVL